MTKDDWDPIRPIRMPDQLWEDLGLAATEKGLDRATVLRDYARRYVAAWKGRQPKGDHDPTSG